MTGNGEFHQLQKCPRCLYLLRGLPLQHQCPECGLGIDRRWRVFGGRLIQPSALRPMRIALAVPFAMMACGVVAGVGFLLAYPGTIDSWILVSVTGGVGVFLVYSAYAKPNKFVAVGPDGIFVYRGPQQSDMYPWERVGRASYNLLRKTLDIEVGGKPVRLGTFGLFRGSVWGAEECVRYINSFERPSHSPASDDDA